MADARESLRQDELAAMAPMNPRGVWAREGNRCYLCGTIGAPFDVWQRAREAVSAADALFAQRIGLEAVERVMDGLEGEIRATLGPNERLLSRRSPGYGDLPLGLSREILARLDATRRLGVGITDSDLLVPTKSVTAICEIIEKGEDK